MKKSNKKKQMKTLIFGTGGFGQEVLWLLNDIYSRKGIKPEAVFMVDDEWFTQKSTRKTLIIKRSDFDPLLYQVVVAIGEPKDRKRIVESLPKETIYISLTHPSVIASDDLIIGKGSIITASCILTVDIVIGKHAHLNLHTSVGHETVIGDYFTTAPGARISGKCKIGNCVYIGTNASIRQGITICDNVTIGMGAVVVKDVIEPGTYVGNPLRKL